MPSVVYLILISSLECLAMSYLPPVDFLIAILWGITLLMAGKYLNAELLSIMLGLNLLLLYGLSGSSNLFFILIIGIPAFIMGQLLIRNRSYYEVQKWGMLTVVLLVSLFLGLAYFSPGNTGPGYRQMEIDQSVAESLKVYEDSGFLTFYAQQGVNPEEMKQDLVLITRWWFMHLPAFYYWVGILSVYLVLVLGEIIGRRWSQPIVGRKPFREEMMPWQLTGVVIAGLSLWLWGWGTANSWYYTGSNLVLIMLPITAYFGLANLVYQRAKLNSNLQRGGLSLIIIATMIVIPPIMIFIALLGLFDSLLDYRKINHEKGDLA
ncbi:MAG: DUF2232 domain-containing protein [Firmicutes bacterium]|nr:DUF2232 domain-containing protein [Bacillota bacterium]